MSAVVLAAGLAGASAASADTGDQLTYLGGPVAHSMKGVVVDWGAGVNPIYTDETRGDPGLIKYLAASSGSPGDISGVLAQYMDSSGANAAPQVSYGGQYAISPSVTASTIYDWQIQHDLVSQIEGGALPRPAAGGLSTIYLFLFPAGDTECLNYGLCSGQALCAYHGNARLSDGTPVLYAVLPDNTSGAMSQSCGSASSALANQTSYTSHEWSEAITDPLVAEAPASNGPPMAWYDANCPSSWSMCGEIGDKCDAEQALNGGWTVQLEWSNLESSCQSSEPRYSSPNAAFATTGGGALAGQPVSFDGTGSSDPSSNHTSISGTSYAIQPGIAAYSWNWGDSTPLDTGATPSHTFAAPGVYQVSLTVTDDLGFSSTVTHAVEVSSATPSAPIASTGGSTGVDATDATVSGSVDTGGQAVSYSFVYGTAPDALGASTAATHVGPGTVPVAVRAALSGLAPATTYYYRLDVEAGGQTNSGDVQSFTTAVASGGGTQGSGTGGSRDGTSGGASGGGTGTGGGTGGTGGGTGTGGAAGGTGGGGTGGGGSTGGGGGSGSTTTSPTPTPAPSPPTGTTATAPRLPSAVTGGVSGVSSAGATIDGSVDPNGAPTTYLVEFGTSSAYGHSSVPASAGAGNANVAVSATLAGLRPRTLYHYRVVATSSAGTSVGVDRTFRTPAALLIHRAGPDHAGPGPGRQAPGALPLQRLLRGPVHGGDRAAGDQGRAGHPGHGRARHRASRPRRQRVG